MKPQYKISTLLTKHNKSEKFVDTFINATEVREVLIEVCREKVEALLTSKKEDYTNSAWAYQQADKNGELRAWKELQDLLTLKERNK
jgi:hypothetical protein